MVSRRWFAAVVLLLGLALRAGAEAETVLRRPVAAEPETLDPHKTTTADDFAIDLDLFEPLVGRDADQHLVPGAAASWEVSADGLTYTFHLRPEGRWSNGDPVVAEDFVYALRRLVAPATGAADIGPIASIVNATAINAGRLADHAALGVDAVDNETLRIRLERRQVTLPLYMSTIYGMPLHRHSIESSGDAWTRPGNLISNGPYRLESWVPNSELVLTRNPAFHSDRPAEVDRVRYLVTDNLETGLKRYLAGEMDWATVPPAKVAWARAGRADLRRGRALGVGFLFFNLKKGPFADHPKLREALSLAIDRETIVDKVNLRGEPPAYGWVAPVIPGYASASYDWRDLPMPARIARARALLAEEGYGPDHPLRFTVRYPTRDETRKMLLAIAGMWKTALGVEATLANQEWRVYVAAVEQWDFEMGSLGRVSEIKDPGVLLEPFISSAGANSDTGYVNPAFDALVSAGEQAPDAAQRFALLHKAEAMMLADYPVMPVSFYVLNRLVTPRIRDWRDNVDNPQSRNIHIAPAQP
ncbi:peptide ABC transporter substrate-binding protein [Aliidongia dinghuensis]|uniref:Peptide ABC transporter substrate-binding protein n=1 Tax=Aliidongia dinghuensis TaxID=1867774 RepID=A0A8J3E1L4_9PROT|nr:peptide ABC transporter substrate-binding protein [Aliidongia dinghuensis]GGF02056.1 peptide ABC transporter substrate-binding protein [Aliidongia dinghuensis]